MPTRQDASLKAFTHRALEASLTGALIPPLVYIPANLRKRGVRVVETVTQNAVTAEENEVRVANADPTGLLIAMMQGQPIPVFEVTKNAKRQIEVRVDWRVPDLLLRAEIAMELSRRQRVSKTAPNDGYTAMMKRAADGLQ